METLPGYLWINFYLGLGIAADVYIVTIATYNNFKGGDLKKWIFLNILTHTAFPLIGMYAVIFGITFWKGIEGALFLGAALVLGVFLADLVSEKTGARFLPSWRNPLWKSFMSWMGKVDRTLPLVLAVSVDALNSGFAKAADTRDWTLFPLLLSFPLVGLVVGGFAVLAVAHARWLLNAASRESRDAVSLSAQKYANLQIIAFSIELVVLGYFFWRSAGSAYVSFGGSEWGNWRWVAALLSALATAIIWYEWEDKLVENIREDASKMFPRELKLAIKPFQIHQRHRFGIMEIVASAIIGILAYLVNALQRSRDYLLDATPKNQEVAWSEIWSGAMNIQDLNIQSSFFLGLTLMLLTLSASFFISFEISKIGSSVPDAFGKVFLLYVAGISFVIAISHVDVIVPEDWTIAKEFVLTKFVPLVVLWQGITDMYIAFVYDKAAYHRYPKEARHFLRMGKLSVAASITAFIIAIVLPMIQQNWHVHFYTNLVLGIVELSLLFYSRYELLRQNREKEQANAISVTSFAERVEHVR